MGILMLAAYLRSKLDVEILLMDQRVENASVESVVRRAVDFGADVVGLSVMTPYASIAGASDAGSACGAARGVACAGRVTCFCFFRFPRRSAGGQCGGCRRVWRGRMRARTGYPGASGGGGANEHSRAALAKRRGVRLPGIPARYPLSKRWMRCLFRPMTCSMSSKYWTVPPMAQLPPHKYLSLFSSRGCPCKCTYCHEVFGKTVSGEFARAAGRRNRALYEGIWGYRF